MFESKTILILEDNGYQALDIALAVEECEGRVAGPISTLAETLAILKSETIAAALVDCDSLDGEAAAVLTLLSEWHVPTVIQTSGRLPQAAEEINGMLTVLSKPVDAGLICDSLVLAIARANSA